MFKHISTKTVPLTSDLAKQFAEMPHSLYERPCKPGRLAFLRARLDDGHFYSPKWAVAVLDGIRYRVNGQHSSTMLAALNGHFPAGLSAVVEEFQCESEQDLADLFMQFDHATSVRSRSDAAGAHQAVHPELRGVSNRSVRNAVAGIAISITQAGDTGRIDADSRIKLLHDNIDFILWASPFMASSPLSTAPIAAAVFSSWKKDPKAAAQFWSLVRDESHPTVNHPSRELARFVAKSVGRRVAGNNARMKWTARALYVKCAHAWNAYRRGGVSDLKYYESAAVPEFI